MPIKFRRFIRFALLYGNKLAERFGKSNNVLKPQILNKKVTKTL